MLQEATPSRPLWLWPNLLSLDAPLIAVLWLHLFALSGRVHLPPTVSLVLGLVVWLIYAADRLLDGLRDTESALQSPRHRFYRTHRKGVLAILLAVLCLTSCICLELDPRTLLFGALMMLVMAAYFGVVHWAGPLWLWRFPKEAAVAIVFGAGSFFPALIRAHKLSYPMAVAPVLFVTLCWLNVVLIEYAEWNRLRRCGSAPPHGSTLRGGRHLLAIGMAIASVSLGLMERTGFRADRSVLCAISLSALALGGLGSYWRKLSTDAVRVLADATLLTPALVLLFLH